MALARLNTLRPADPPTPCASTVSIPRERGGEVRLRSWYESSPAPMAAAGGSRFFGPRYAERVADGGDRFPLVFADMFATDPQDTAPTLPAG
jgi:hypothetical protein